MTGNVTTCDATVAWAELVLVLMHAGSGWLEQPGAKIGNDPVKLNRGVLAIAASGGM